MSELFVKGGCVRRSIISLVIAFQISVLGCAVLWGQATAEISGTANDQSGAVLPGVEITVTQTDTGISRSTVTNETGSYVLPNLAIGPYRLEAGLPGFRTYVQTGIVLQVNSSPVINVVLEVGQVSEQVEVQANAALVETRSSTVGSVIENERILELPLNGRVVTDLISLAGGAVQQGNGGGRTGGGSPMIAVAGGAGWGVDYTLDGANHSSFVSGSTLLMPFPDAMQEFKVETSGVSAQRGNPTAVAAVTKSGTNELHGNLFEFVRNDLLNARSYFAIKNSTLKRNQWGGTLGGPIVKNKLFFFGAYQGTTLRADPADNRTFIPTAAMMAGDWTTFASPACNNGRQINLRSPFVNNRIDPNLYSKPALYVVNFRGAKPFPTPQNECGEITYGSQDASNDAYYLGKVDYQQSDAHSLFGRVLLYTRDNLNPDKFNTNLLQSTGWSNPRQYSYTFGSTYLISSNIVQAFRLAVNRSAEFYHNTGEPGTSKLFSWCDAGVKIYCEPIVQRINGLSISGAFSLGGGFLTGHKYVGNTFSLNDDVSVVRGVHQMSFGVAAMHGRQSNQSNFASSTQITFNGSFTGLGLSDFMLGRVNTILMAKTNAHHVNGTNIAVYAADTWKMNQRLTLNYGLRWEPYIPHKTEAIFNFDYDRFLRGIKSTVFPNAPAGLYYRGDPGFPENGIFAQWLHFAPRMGLAWQVTGDGKTSVRASYALGYVPVPGNFRETYSGQSPWGNRINLVGPVGGLEDPWRDVPGGNIFPYDVNKNAPFPAFGQFYSQRYDTKIPHSQTWNLAIQRQVAADLLVSASYTGSNLMHVWGNKPINPATYFPQASCTLNGVTYTPCSSTSNTNERRRFSLERPQEGAKLGFVAEADDGGTQVYHGMLLSIERRAAQGVSVSANYTYSHCIGPYATLYNPMAIWASDTYADPNDRQKDQGNCDSDRRQIFNLTSVAETPQFANAKMRLLASGWRLSGIYRRSTGSYLTVLAGSDRALNGLQVNATGINVQRAHQVGANPFLDKSGGPQTTYLNIAAFAAPEPGTLGNVGRSNIVGPGTWAFDLALSRVFRFRETQRFEFRAEAYNVTNSFRPGTPNSTITNNTFGVIRTSSDPRILQFALKYVF
jgi:hypothetical protein